MKSLRVVAIELDKDELYPNMILSDGSMWEWKTPGESRWEDRPEKNGTLPFRWVQVLPPIPILAALHVRDSTGTLRCTVCQKAIVL